MLRNSLSDDYVSEEKEDSYDILKPLSANSLASLLWLSQEDVTKTLEDLYPIFDFSENYSRSIRLQHPSFRLFILNSERCPDQQLYVDKK